MVVVNEDGYLVWKMMTVLDGGLGAVVSLTDDEIRMDLGKR